MMENKPEISADAIFSITSEKFEQTALEVFRFQHNENKVYRNYCDLLHIDPLYINRINTIPYLPITFFKNEQVKSTNFNPQAIFESSGTTGDTPSTHYVKDLLLYKESFNTAFKLMYGDIKEYCIIALLPSYLERSNASLVYMADHLIKNSKHPQSGFYLNDFTTLHQTLLNNEARKQRTLLIGVTFALLDFASAYPLPLKHTIVMETGGMKGRRKEMTRQEVHAHLKKQFDTDDIHSEYGMTELLSQAYAKKDGLFSCPPWMKVLKREIDDPFCISSEDSTSAGLANIIDLANLFSCAFIATDDVVRLQANNSFEILGRSDNSELRGCSLMI